MNFAPPITQHLIILNCIFFFAQITQPLGDYLFDYFALYSFSTSYFQVWQVLSYGFLHGDMFHLLFNMIGLYMFGSKIEMVWGQKRMLGYFLLCVVGAGLTQLAWQYLLTTNAMFPPIFAPTIGASGGVMGIVLAYGVLFPDDELMLILFPIPIKAKYFVMLYAAAELYNGVFYSNSGIAHFAHLGGMLFGLIPVLMWRSKSKRFF